MYFGFCGTLRQDEGASSVMGFAFPKVRVTLNATFVAPGRIIMEQTYIRPEHQHYKSTFLRNYQNRINPRYRSSPLSPLDDNQPQDGAHLKTSFSLLFNFIDTRHTREPIQWIAQRSGIAEESKCSAKSSDL